MYRYSHSQNGRAHYSSNPQGPQEPEQADLRRQREEEKEFEKLQAKYERKQKSVFSQIGEKLQLAEQEGLLTRQKQKQEEQQKLLRQQIGRSDNSVAVQTPVTPPVLTEQPSGAQIFVCTNKFCREKGADATMATFSFLAGSTIPVVPVNCLGRCNKGPNVRILTPDSAFIEASMVRSVETVVSLLQEHLNLNVNITSAEVLRLNYEGNVFLREGEVDYAIDRYNRALALGDKEQEGVILVMRGSALLQRAYACRLRYKDIMAYAEMNLPSLETIEATIEVVANSNLPGAAKGTLTMDYLSRLSGTGATIRSRKESSSQSSDGSGSSGTNSLKWAAADKDGAVPGTSEILRKANFSSSLYEFALMGALEDLLTATILLPGFAQAWRRAGDALGELQHFNSAIEYLEVALRLDQSLSASLVPQVAKWKLMQKISQNAQQKGYSKDEINSLLEDVVNT